MIKDERDRNGAQRSLALTLLLVRHFLLLSQLKCKQQHTVAAVISVVAVVVLIVKIIIHNAVKSHSRKPRRLASLHKK